MWIRTSDKKRVIFCGTVGKLVVSKHKGTDKDHFKTDGKGYVFLDGERIGEYVTEERAIEVLDEICNSYQYAKECAAIGIGAAKPEFVYYMPEE